MTRTNIGIAANSATTQKAIAALTERGDQLEAALNRETGTVNAVATAVSIDAIRSRLGADELLIEYVSFEARPEDGANVRRYGAFVLDNAGSVGWRDLGPAARVRPDMKVVFFDDWEDPKARVRGTAAILRNLVTLAQPAKAA